MADSGDQEARIMAFLDGAMSDEELADFEAELERDDALAGEVERLIGNDQLLRAAYAAPVEEGVNDALLQRMGLADQAVEQSFAMAPPANDNPPFWRGWKVPFGAALAASLAVALTFSLRTPQENAMNFADALDRLPSGESVQLANGDELAPVLSFAAADGRFCREFRVTGEAGDGGGVACRDQGNWAVVALTENAPDLASMDQIELASGASSASLNEAYDVLGATDPFDAARERDLIEAGWRTD